MYALSLTCAVDDEFEGSCVIVVVGDRVYIYILDTQLNEFRYLTLDSGICLDYIAHARPSVRKCPGYGAIHRRVLLTTDRLSDKGTLVFKRITINSLYVTWYIAP